ncbi:hypothetical protein TIFTF001_055539 [Ficus carica]|uniref:Uncharacterized protein n=1 Tax=Ficus carica TaxID=3494 RepID=A0AA88EKQ7_FICCA|nr:hypothetical protein TIFTF001_055539 [Ficus carica]
MPSSERPDEYTEYPWPPKITIYSDPNHETRSSVTATASTKSAPGTKIIQGRWGAYVDTNFCSDHDIRDPSHLISDPSSADHTQFTDSLIDARASPSCRSAPSTRVSRIADQNTRRAPSHQCILEAKGP